MNKSEKKVNLTVEHKLEQETEFLDEEETRSKLRQIKFAKVADELERIERKESKVESEKPVVPIKEILPADSKEEIKHDTTGSEPNSKHSLPPYIAPFRCRYALTLGEQSEIRPGTLRIGNGLASRGFTLDDLTEFKERLGDCARLVMLHECLEIESERNKKTNQAALLVIKNGINVLMEDGYYASKMYQEQKELRYDRKFFDAIYRQETVQNKARKNAMFADKGCQHSEDYKQPTVIAYDSAPLLKAFRNKLPEFFGNKARVLNCEGNQYFEPKSGINFHGDSERKKVICGSLGRTMTLRFVWRAPGGKKLCSKAIDVRLEHGDMYIMSEKTTGFDWQYSEKYHLVHAAGETQIDLKKAIKTSKFGHE
jgi:alkylated DNA repair dioxygenase AlkB